VKVSIELSLLFAPEWHRIRKLAAEPRQITAEMLEYKLKASGLGDERHLPEQRSLDIVAHKS
jgi:hypothetical protein